MFDETRSTLSSHTQTTVHGPVESAGTDGFAIASLVLGLLGIVPLGVGFGIRALRRIRRSGKPGRGLAITGLVFSVLWLCFGFSLITPKTATRSTAGSDYLVQSMAIGECLDSAADGGQVIRVACDVPHDEQIVTRIDVANGETTYPGRVVLQELAQTLCRLASAGYFTGGGPPPGFDYPAHIPTESAWNAGNRDATCTLRRSSGKLTAFVRP